MPKPKKVGRPKLPKGEAKGKIVPVRFTGEALKAIESQAKANNKTVPNGLEARWTQQFSKNFNEAYMTYENSRNSL